MENVCSSLMKQNKTKLLEIQKQHPDKRIMLLAEKGDYGRRLIKDVRSK